MADYTYYEILDVAQTATPQEIKSAYQRAVRVAHPDVGGTSAMFGLVRAAYETLSDPDERAAYDDELRHGQFDDEPADAPGNAGNGTVNGFPRRNSYGGSFGTPPEPEWGVEVAWPDGHVDGQRYDDDLGSWGATVYDEPASPSQPRPAHQPWLTNSGRYRLRDRYAFWTASRAGMRGLVVLVVAALALYALYAVILFGNPHLIRPDAAAPDAFHWVFVDGPFLRIIVIIYTLALAGALFGAAPYVLAGHALGLVGLIAWLAAYWDAASAGERLTFAGLAFLWIVYSVLLLAIPLTLSTRRAMHGQA